MKSGISVSKIVLWVMLGAILTLVFYTPIEADRAVKAAMIEMEQEYEQEKADFIESRFHTCISCGSLYVKNAAFEEVVKPNLFDGNLCLYCIRDEYCKCHLCKRYSYADGGSLEYYDEVQDTVLFCEDCLYLILKHNIPTLIGDTVYVWSVAVAEE